ncbi:MAG: hypothetical protein K2Q18_11990 [Bdellovibrionales bacterium]|nr:hypothetical protein [Bdellovibrionales bacterium]
MKKLLLALSLSLSFNVLANDCQDLVKCVETVSKLTGKKYLFDGRLKGELKASSNVQITAENADTLFSYILNITGYSRVPTLEKDTYKIVESRDIRYESLATFSATLTETPSTPKTEDYVLVTYQLTNFKDGQSREIANSLRPFMSRYGRIIESYASNTLTLQETASKVSQLLDIIRKSDRALTVEEITMKKEREETREKKKLANQNVKLDLNIKKMNQK